MLSKKDIIKKLSYNPMTGIFVWRDSGKEAGCVNAHGYRAIGLRLHKAHRLAWLYVHGEWPDGAMDHINGERNDNRLCNLRLVTVAENNKNKRMPGNNTSGVVGVRWVEARQTWAATINDSGTRVWLGSRRCMTAAVLLRSAAEKRLGYHVNHGSTL